MIGRLRGQLLVKQAPHLLVEVQGVGYEVDAPMSTFYVLPELGSEVILHTHLVVREDSHVLYGFASETERAMFRSLIKISGVGPKLALTILSGISADALVQCVQRQDSSSLTRLPGVGKKTAERLIIELKDRIKDWEGGAVSMPMPAGKPLEAKADSIEDAVSALIALGYKPPEASRMVRSVAEAETLSSEEIIRQALQNSIR